jgi:hypothetical protein
LFLLDFDGLARWRCDDPGAVGVMEVGVGMQRRAERTGKIARLLTESKRSLQDRRMQEEKSISIAEPETPPDVQKY